MSSRCRSVFRKCGPNVWILQAERHGLSLWRSVDRCLSSGRIIPLPACWAGGRSEIPGSASAVKQDRGTADNAWRTYDAWRLPWPSSHSEPHARHLWETPESRIPEPRTTSFGVSVDSQSGHRYRASLMVRPPTRRAPSVVSVPAALPHRRRYSRPPTAAIIEWGQLWSCRRLRSQSSSGSVAPRVLPVAACHLIR